MNTLPIILSLKYELIAACALASTSGSIIETNCVSCASTLAGFNDDTSSMVHSNSNCVEHICGVAGRWNNDGLFQHIDYYYSIFTLNLQHNMLMSNIECHNFGAYLSINGKCRRSVMPTSNGLTILRNRDGGVGVFTIGNEWNVPFRDFRIEFGVWNSFVMVVTLDDVVTTFVVKLLIPVFNDWFAKSIASRFPCIEFEFIFHWYRWLSFICKQNHREITTETLNYWCTTKQQQNKITNLY